MLSIFVCVCAEDHGISIIYGDLMIKMFKIYFRALSYHSSINPFVFLIDQAIIFNVFWGLNTTNILLEKTGQTEKGFQI